MKRVLSVEIRTIRLPLSHASVRALGNLGSYAVIAFTSKNARKFFMQELKERRLKLPRHLQIVHVGPRDDLLKSPLKGKRVLFPRSTRAPYDIVNRLRRKGAFVRTLPLYTVHGISLSTAQRASLLQGEINALYFRSPSGVMGLLQQFRGEKRKLIQHIPAQCIGKTTAKAAKEAGFRKVSVKRVY